MGHQWNEATWCEKYVLNKDLIWFNLKLMSIAITLNGYLLYIWWGYVSQIKLSKRQKARETDHLYGIVDFTKMTEDLNQPTAPSKAWRHQNRWIAPAYWREKFEQQWATRPTGPRSCWVLHNHAWSPTHAHIWKYLEHHVSRFYHIHASFSYGKAP